MAYSIKFKEFENEVEPWKQYAERLGDVLTLKTSWILRRRAHLLSCIGPTTYSLLTGLVAPDKLTDKSYNELVKVLSDHFDSQQSEIVESFKFHTRTRRLGESVTSFVAELRRLAKYCNYASLNDLLRDRIVCYINDECIHTKTSSVRNSCEAYLG